MNSLYRLKILILFCILTPLAWAGSGQKIDLGRVVAIVNDDVITSNQLDEQLSIVVQQMDKSGTHLPPKNILKKQILQHLIDVDLQMQMAKSGGIAISSEDIDDAIKNVAKTNNLTVAQLRKAVESQSLTWSQYRDNIKKEITMARLQQAALGKNIIITDQMVNDYLKSNAAKENANLEYRVKNILVPLPETPSPQDIKQAKATAQKLLSEIKQGADFSQLAIAQSSSENALQGGDLGYRQLAALPEVFATKVVNMKAGDVVGPIRTANGFHIIKLVGKKGAEQQHFVNLTHVRHILIKTDAVNTPQLVKKKLNDIKAKIAKGAKFTAMAKQYSQDLGNAKKGGDLGWVHPGELVTNFEQTMDKLPLNTVSKPVETQFGWHLIEVLGRKKIDDSKSFKQQQVRQLLYQRKFNQAVQNWLQELRGQAYIKIMDKDVA